MPQKDSRHLDKTRQAQRDRLCPTRATTQSIKIRTQRTNLLLPHSFSGGFYFMTM